MQAISTHFLHAILLEIPTHFQLEAILTETIASPQNNSIKIEAGNETQQKKPEKCLFLAPVNKFCGQFTVIYIIYI